MLTLKTVSSFPRLGAQPYTQVCPHPHALRGNEGNVASSQALAWEFSAGSSSFPSREAATAWMQEVEQRREQLPRASLTGFPSRSLGTSVTSITITQELK